MKQATHKEAQYSEGQATKWLSWLAKKMRAHDQTVFLIEELQVSWLMSPKERSIHGVLCISIIVIIGTCIHIFLAILSKALGAEGAVAVSFMPVVGLIFGLSIGLIFSYLNKGTSISSIDRIFWSWKNLRNNYQDGLKKKAFREPVLGLSVGTMGGILFGLNEGVGLSWDYVWKYGILFGLIGFILGIIATGWKKEISQTTSRPNEGMIQTIQSCKKGFFLGFIGGIIGGIVAGYTIGHSAHFIQFLSVILVRGIGFGLSAGFIFGLWFGGMTLLRHYVLRALIYFKTYGPWDYAHFLDYCVEELQFLQHVGGGYIFIHRMLLEHFAEME